MQTMACNVMSFSGFDPLLSSVTHTLFSSRTLKKRYGSRTLVVVKTWEMIIFFSISKHAICETQWPENHMQDRLFRRPRIRNSIPVYDFSILVFM